MTALRLYFLGPPRIELAGKQVEIDTRKATALLAYLALTGERIDRDALAALLWPELDDSRGRAALRRTLSALKGAIGGEFLHATRTVIGLESNGTWCDVTEVRRQLAGEPALDDLRAAVELYRDDFLAGFTLRDSLIFDDWQLVETQNLRRTLESSLEKLVEAGLARGDVERALPYAERWLQLDPLREEAHRQLMRLFTAAGRRDAALRQYRECVRVLEEELGVSPLPETTALYEAIQGNQLSFPPPPPPIQAVAPAAEPALIPLIGREPELALLRQRYGEVGPDGRLLVITGEVGIGKTRLAETFLNQIPRAPRLVARCYEGEQTLAYVPFLQALNEALDRPDTVELMRQVDPLWLAEAARLLPALTAFTGEATPASGDGPGAQSRFFEGVAQVVAALLEGETPGIFLIDDAHWADGASLDLLAYLTRRQRGQPYFILLTAREEDLPAGHRLETLLNEARLNGSGARMTLSRLVEADVAELVRATGKPAVVAARLFRETEGLPSFLAAYLADLSQDAAEDSWTLPRSVRDLLHVRLAGVAEAERQLLQAAAAIGRAFDVDLLQKASGRGEEEIINGLETLLNSRLLAEQEGQPTFDFSHDKLRQMVYEETRLVRRRLLHRRLAAALDEQARRQRGQSLAGQIAHHYQLAGQEEAAAAYFKLAGDQARALYANREALTHYQDALALGHPEPAALHEACGDLYTLQGEYGRARASYETAASLALTDAGLGRLEHKLGQVYLREGEWLPAERQLRRAETLYRATAQSAALAALFHDLSYGFYRQQRPAPAREMAQEARALAETAGDRLSLAQTANILGILARQEGEYAAAITYLEESCRLAEEAGELPVRAAGLNNLALTYTAAGKFDLAERHLQAALALGEMYGDRHHQAALHNNLADLFHQTGQKEKAMDHLKQAVALYAELGGVGSSWQPEVWKLADW